MSIEVPSPLAGRAAALSAYETLLVFLQTLGPICVEEKKTCLHVTAGKAAFLGVHPRKEGLRMTIVLTRALDGERIVKAERASARRVYNDLDWKTGIVDDELQGWLREAYALSAA